MNWAIREAPKTVYTFSKIESPSGLDEYLLCSCGNQHFGLNKFFFTLFSETLLWKNCLLCPWPETVYNTFSHSSTQVRFKAEIWNSCHSSKCWFSPEADLRGMVLERLHKLGRGLGMVNARRKVKDLIQGAKVLFQQLPGHEGRVDWKLG